MYLASYCLILVKYKSITSRISIYLDSLFQCFQCHASCCFITPGTWHCMLKESQQIQCNSVCSFNSISLYWLCCILNFTYAILQIKRVGNHSVVTWWNCKKPKLSFILTDIGEGRENYIKNINLHGPSLPMSTIFSVVILLRHTRYMT